MVTFGYVGALDFLETIYGQFGNGQQSANIVGSKFVCPFTGTISSISAYLFSPTLFYAKVAIYNEDLTLLAQTGEAAGISGAWNPFLFDSPVSVTAGNTYWLVASAYTVGFDTNIVCIGYVTGTTDQGVRLDDVEWATVFPDPLEDATNADRKDCIYCTYTPVISTNIDLIKDRLLIELTDSSYDAKLGDALTEAMRYAVTQILAYDMDFSILLIEDDTALLDAILDIAAGIFKRRHMPRDMDQGWWGQGLKKLAEHITATYKIPIVYFSETEE